MILILGGRGFIGSAFARRLTETGISFHTVDRRKVDATDRDRLVEVIRETNPEFLINAAGYTGNPNVDACETHKADCLSGNAVVPGIVREACELCGVPWGHVSSGCIYNGHRTDGSGFRETDPRISRFDRPRAASIPDARHSAKSVCE